MQQETRTPRLKIGKVIEYVRVGRRKIKYVIGKTKKRKRERVLWTRYILALRRIWLVFDFILRKTPCPFYG